MNTAGSLSADLRALWGWWKGTQGSESKKCDEGQRSLQKGLLKHREESSMSTQASGKLPQKISKNMLTKYEKGKVSCIHFDIHIRLGKQLVHKHAQLIATKLLNRWIKRLVFPKSHSSLLPPPNYIFPHVHGLQPQREPPNHYSSLSLPGLLQTSQKPPLLLLNKHRCPGWSTQHLNHEGSLTQMNTHFLLENGKCWVRGGKCVLCGHHNNHVTSHLASSMKPPHREDFWVCWVTYLYTQAQNTCSSQYHEGWTQHALCPFPSHTKKGDPKGM